MPMDYAGADIQGAIGYMFVKALSQRIPHAAASSASRSRSSRRRWSTATTRRSPIPPSRSARTWTRRRAKELAAEQGWTVSEDAGRGWRRVVPSPLPQAIVEIEVIEHSGPAPATWSSPAAAAAFRSSRTTQGDLQRRRGGDRQGPRLEPAGARDRRRPPPLSTGVEKVAHRFQQAAQRWLDRMTLAEAKPLRADDQFDKGSMGPKIQALIDFSKAAAGGADHQPAEHRARARGETGTRSSPTEKE